MLDEGMSQAPVWTEWDGTRFYHTIRTGIQFETYGLFISENFHLIFQTTAD